MLLLYRDNRGGGEGKAKRDRDHSCNANQSASVYRLDSSCNANQSASMSRWTKKHFMGVIVAKYTYHLLLYYMGNNVGLMLSLQTTL